LRSARIRLPIARRSLALRSPIAQPPRSSPSGMRWLTYRGQYCRDCDTAQFREVQRATMLAGWWGYFSFVANTYNVFHNLNVERGLRGLGAPQGRVRAPKPTPETVFKSPGFAVTLCLPFVLYLLVTQVWT
jgi:hypothetical protein